LRARGASPISSTAKASTCLDDISLSLSYLCKKLLLTVCAQFADMNVHLE
jgi:hypothetical protein